MEPQYIRRITVNETLHEFDPSGPVSRFVGPFATKEEAEKYTAPGMVGVGTPEVYCIWPPDKESGGKK